MAWPVEPKPPRAVEEDDEDDDELELLPLCSDELLDAKPTEVEVGARPELLYELYELECEYQCQPREPDEVERLHGCCCAACCCTAGCAPGAATPCCTAGLPRSMMSRTGAGCAAWHAGRVGSM